LSGHLSGYSGFGGDLNIPGIGPDSPDLGVRILRLYVQVLRIFGFELHTGQTGLTGGVYRSDRCGWAEQG